MQWGRSQAREELKAARKEVAAEEFRTHLGLLTGFADSIVLTICITSSPKETRHAKDVLGMLYERDRLHEVDFIPAIDPTERGKRRAALQNQLLFESLRAHTYGRVRWQALGEWEDAWDTCRENLIKLGEEAHEVLSNILDQKSKLTDRIVKGSGKKDAIERMVDGVLHVVWHSILTGKLDQKFPFVRAMSRSDGMNQVIFCDSNFT